MTEQPEDAEILRDEPAGSDSLVNQEEEAAAAEAGEIGGPAPDTDADPADRPVEEAGGGEAEGFEQAEDALRLIVLGHLLGRRGLAAGPAG